jgi:PAS domain S-box-containing protein
MSRVPNLAKQKQLQEALRESEQRYQKLLESVTDCIYTVKVKGGRAKGANTSRSAIATSYSPSCVAITGYTAAEYAADPQLWERMIYEEDREAVRQQVAKILSGETVPSLEHRIVHKDGSIRWVRNTPVVHQDKQGRIVSYEGLISDITQRKKAEEALREREHFIQRVAEAMPGLLYVYDLIEQRNVYVNRRQITEILGYSPEAVQAMGATVLPTLTHPDDLPKIAAYHQRCTTAKDREVLEIEYRMRDANGEWHWLLSRDIVFARTADGSVQQVLGTATDITHLKQVEEDLRQSEERFRVALKNAPIVVFNQDTELRYTWIYNPLPGANVEDVVGKLDAELVTAEDAQRLTAIKRQVLTDGVGRRLEESLTINGDVRYYDLTVEPMRDRCGEIVGIACVALDISDRKQAEKALRESEQLFRLVADAAPVMIWMSDTDACCIFFNQPWLTFTGRSREQEAGEGWIEGVHPEDVERCLHTYRSAFNARQNFSMEYRLRRADSEYRWILDTGVPRFNVDGSFAGYIGSCVDISDVYDELRLRKQAEEALRKSQRFIQRITETVPGVIYIYDLSEERNVYVNHQVGQILGYTPEEIQTLGSQFLPKLIHPEDLVNILASHEHLPTVADGEIREMEYRMRHANGEWRWLLSRDTVFLRNPDGSPKQLLGAAQDITKRKQAEEALQKAKQELEIRVQQRTSELSNAISLLKLANSQLQQELLGRKQIEAALRESEERYALAVNAGGVGVWDWNLETDEIYLDPSWKATLGFADDEISNHVDDWSELVHPDDWERVWSAVNAHLQGLTPELGIEHRMFHKDGSVRWILVRGTAIRDASGKPYRMTGAHTDITERKQIETALRESEQRLQALLDNSTAVIYAHDTQDRYLLINRTYENLFHITKEEIVGKSVYDIWPREIADVFVANNKKVLEAKTPLEFEEVAPHADGLHTYIAIKFALYDADGVPYAVCGMSTDITERKRAEEALQAAHSELEKYVIELATTNEELQSTLEELTFSQEEVQTQNENLIETQQFLEVERRRYQELFNFAPDAYLMTDVDGTIQQANQAAATLLGVSQQELVGTSLTIFVSEGDDRVSAAAPEEQANCLRHRNAFHGKLGQLGQLQRVHDWEVRLRGRGGLSFFAAITVATVLDPNGKSVGLRWLIRDISDRKRAEETIKQQAEWERLLGTITNNIRESLNLDRILATTVTEVRQLLQADRVIVFRLCPDGVGRTIAEAVAPGQPTFIEEQFPDESFPEECYEFYRQGNVRIVPEIEKDEVASCLIEFFQELGVKSKLVVPLLQDTSVWGVLSAHYCTESPRRWQDWEIDLLQRLAGKVAIAIQQAELYQKVQTELIERKRAEKELRTNQQRQALLLCSVPVVLYTARPFDDYGPTWVSENMEQLSGFSSHQLIDDPSFWASRIHPEDRERVLQETSTMSGNQGEMATEYRWQCADGTYRWFLDRAVLSQDEEGKPKEVIGSFVDITQLKQAEEEMRKALAQEKELNELKSRFVSMASHEFRTPLSAILSSADLLEYYVREGAVEKQLEHIQRIQTSCVNMTELLNDILIIGRVEAGKLDFKPLSLDLAELCGNLLEELQLIIDSKHKLTFASQDEYIPACMDEKLLRHILTNLLSNAIKYSPKGGNIQLKLFCQDGAGVFQIQDEGIGIPKEDQPRLFESFHRAKNVGTIPGTGLGLAIVKRSVDLHGGQIAIASEVGVGTTVTVTLPLNGCSQTDEEDSGD